MYISGLHHKQSATDYKDFTLVKFTSQMFSSSDKFLKGQNVSTSIWFSRHTARHIERFVATS